MEEVGALAANEVTTGFGVHLKGPEVEVLNPFHPPAPANRSVKRSNWA